MSWWQMNFSGIGRQKSQRSDSGDRLLAASLERLQSAGQMHQQASREVQIAASRRMEAGKPLNDILGQLLDKLVENSRK